MSEYSWNHYGKWKNVQNLKNQYPRVKTIHYPKAGSRNGILRILTMMIEFLLLQWETNGEFQKKN